MHMDKLKKLDKMEKFIEKMSISGGGEYFWKKNLFVFLVKSNFLTSGLFVCERCNYLTFTLFSKSKITQRSGWLYYLESEETQQK
jgi:hypothetical protein